ncbi:MAG: NADH:ubiquinone oxidoreductase [Zestosphaera tikiterensis]|uniref:NADH:ubiquinone oxidoreductase n=1 Tax=Zestosphaera tikiterensis TaxID=1973259 RepID=A0A2R7Y4U9_9CREN|nr:MAG: NADH:ubiquinone oxidoreductase [Zestosphaera tikiterensis]
MVEALPRNGSVDLAKAFDKLKRSIWVFHLNTGSCNGCDIEVLDVLTPYFDVERFGIKLVGSPRHADLILLTGPITIKTLDKVVRAIDAMPRPRLVLALGSCGVGGGIWFNTYSTLGGYPKLQELLKSLGVEVDKVVYVPGCPVRPEAIIYGVALLLGLAEPKVRYERVEAVEG